MPATDRDLHNFLPTKVKQTHSRRKDALLELIMSECIFKRSLNKKDLNYFLVKVRQKSIALQETIDQLENLKKEYYKTKREQNES